MLAFGVVAAILEARRSGQGQVVDAAMVDGAASLMTMTYAFRQAGLWSEERGVNMLDTGAPFYEVYETADGKWFAVGAIEPQFYAELFGRLGLDARRSAGPDGPEPVAGDEGAVRRHLRHPDPRRVDGALRRDRRLRGPGALTVGGARASPQRHRDTFVEVDGDRSSPAPRPGFSRTPASRPASAVGGRSGHRRGPGGLGCRRATGWSHRCARRTHRLTLRG